MRIDIHHHYNAAPATVRAMLADPAFWQYALADQVEQFEADPIPDGLSMKLGVPAPSQLKAFTSDTLAFTLQATWQQEGTDTWTGPIVIDAGKLPGSFSGATTISPSDGGTDVAYTGDFTIRVPLIGKSIEQKALPYMTSVLDGQQAKGTAWLADHAY